MCVCVCVCYLHCDGGCGGHSLIHSNKRHIIIQIINWTLDRTRETDRQISSYAHLTDSEIRVCVCVCVCVCTGFCGLRGHKFV